MRVQNGLLANQLYKDSSKWKHFEGGFCLLIIERLKCKLSKWINLYISKGGRLTSLTIIQSVLSDLPTYYLSIFHILGKAAKKMEKVLRDFLWEGPNSKGKTHLVIGKSSASPSRRGLNMRNIKKRNIDLLSKWIWIYLTEIW